MKHRITQSDFKALSRNLGVFLAHSSLRKTLRPFVQFQANARGIIVVVIDTRWVHRYIKAAELLMRPDRWTLSRETLRRSVVVIDKRSNTEKDFVVDTLGSLRQVIVLTTSLDFVPQYVMRAADVIVNAAKPTARQIAGGRCLAGLPRLTEAILFELANQSMNVIETFAARQTLSAEDFMLLTSNPSVKGQDIPNAAPKLSQIPGYKSVRPWVADLTLDLEHWKSGALHWREIDHGIVLEGPSGTGKTFFASALAGELGIPLVTTSVASWQASGDGFLGDMLKAMRKAFDEALSKKPAVLFIDELDGLQRRISGGRNAYYQSQVINAFLELTDGLIEMEGVIFVGATNRISDIDPAVLRSGRLENQFHIGLPDDEERAGILDHHMPGAFEIGEIREVTDGFGRLTAADVQLLSRRAKRTARKGGRRPVIADVKAHLPKKLRIPAATLHRMAVHECGHALVALASNLTDDIVIELEDTIILDSTEYQEGGRVRYRLTEDILPTEATLLGRIRIALAGMAAEEVVEGSRSIVSVR